ncbi:hypothetical protein [Rhodosalinus sediminis]|uniref:hypothetical protein n=1 Tax=Rhodosalinus sediminis TaxID=1940533 RepID=UPI002353BFC7|nr:hypothetical protein [Rhodosalinus sediminis]
MIQKTYIIPVKSALVALLFSASFAGAQDTSATSEGGVDDLLMGVTDVATGLQDTVAELGDALEESAQSPEKGQETLEAMLAAAHDVNESLDEDSEIWVDLNVLLDQWSERRDELAQRAEEVPRLSDVVDEWQLRIDNAMELRTQILDQASASSLLVDQIEADREVVLAWYEVGAADRVLQTMQKMSDQLGAMNAQMQSIVDQTGSLGGGEVAQN